MDKLVKQGLELMGFGLVGVFITLSVFIILIYLLSFVLPYKDEDK